MVSGDQAGNGARLKRSGLLSQSLYMSVRSATKAPRGMRPCFFSQALEISDGKCVVRILREIWRIVEHDERQDHLFERDLVHRDPFLVEMRRRIDMRAVLADDLIERGAKAVVFDGVWPLRLWIGCGRHLCLAKSRPHRRLRAEAVREIDE